MSELKPGLVGEAEAIVTPGLTAEMWGSGLVQAYSTPAMIGLMENASVIAIQKHLSQDQTSVGMEINIRHLSATPIGMQVRSRAELVAVEESRLKFKVEAWDEKEKIGEGTHVRAVVDAKRFTERLRMKSAKTI